MVTTYQFLTAGKVAMGVRSSSGQGTCKQSSSELCIIPSLPAVAGQSLAGERWACLPPFVGDAGGEKGVVSFLKYHPLLGVDGADCLVTYLPGTGMDGIPPLFTLGMETGVAGQSGGGWMVMSCPTMWRTNQSHGCLHGNFIFCFYYGASIVYIVCMVSLTIISLSTIDNWSNVGIQIEHWNTISAKKKRCFKYSIQEDSVLGIENQPAWGVDLKELVEEGAIEDMMERGQKDL